MAITQAVCTSFLQELLQGIHDFDVDVFNLALFRAQASIVGTFGANTTNYSDMGADEASGTNYSAGGAALTVNGPSSSGLVAYVDFDDLTFSNVTLTTSGALIYNTSKANRAVMVLNFGGDKTKSAQDLDIVFPTADAQTALLRLSGTS